MQNNWKGKRIASLLVSLALLLTMLPQVWRDEVAAAEDPYAQYVGQYATLTNMATDEGFLVLESEPDYNWPEDSLVFYPSEFSSDITFVIQNYKLVSRTDTVTNADGGLDQIIETTLWYQVNIVEGTAPQTDEEGIPGFQDGYWILQNYLNEEDAYETDTLTLITPEYSGANESIVSNGGITVSGGNAELTELTVEESDYVPKEYFVQNYVVYNVTPKTENGEYTDYATVTIPVPEGWDTEKVFGFVVEADGSMSVIPGKISTQGTFCFTVPHFSDVGVFEATSTADVKNVTITFGPVYRETNVFDFVGTYGTEGKYLSTDGKVEYVVNHVTVSDVDYTYITFRGLDVTVGTLINVGDLQIVAIVKQGTAQVEKLLAGAGTAASTTLYPMYDLGFSGDFDIIYTLTSGGDYVTLEESTITSKGEEGDAIVVAEVKHKTSGSIVGTVTYNITTTTAAVTDVKNIYVPKGGTVQIQDMTGDLADIAFDPNIVTVAYDKSNNVLSLTGVAESGMTSVIVGSTLFRVYAEPENPNGKYTVSVLIKITEIRNCFLYYAINGGTLHKVQEVDSEYVLIGLSSSEAQSFPDGINLMFFTAPIAGHTTSYMAAPGTAGQFYALANGFRYDGSDSGAWPLESADANYSSFVGYDGDSSIWKTGHGFRWSLLGGNMTIAEMRDLFTRALALGCDAATTFTRNENGKPIEQNTFYAVAEKLLEFNKEIKKVVRDEKDITGTTDAEFLKIGDEVTYQFTVRIPSKYIYYETIKVSDATIGMEIPSFSHEVSKEGVLSSTTSLPDGVIRNSITENGETVYLYTSTCNYKIIGDSDEIKKYAGGMFTNTASLTYEYQSVAASSKTATTITASVTANVGGVVTWMDNLGDVWKVDVPEQTILPDDPPLTNKAGYEFKGWEKDNVVGLTKGDDGKYTVSFAENQSITILGTFMPIEYNLTFALEGGSLSGDVSNPTLYTIEDILKLPTPSKLDHKFEGWEVTSAEGNWTEGTVYTGEKTLLQMYGNATLTAKWSEDKTTYTVTWVNWDGTELETDHAVGIGSMPEYNSGLPSRNSGDASRAYVFVGWTPALTPVTGDVTYTAVYSDTTAQYKITFENYDGKVLSEAWYDYGTEADAIERPADPTKPETAQYTYAFTGWTPEIEKVTQNATYTATYTPVSKTANLTIKVEGSREDLDPEQSYLFNVTGSNGEVLQVVLHEGKDFQVTICGLTIGQEYTITMENDWSWRYESKEVGITAAKHQGAAKTTDSITLILQTSDVVTFTVDRPNGLWLDGNSWWDSFQN